MQGFYKEKDDFLIHCKYEKNLTKKTLYAYEVDLLQFIHFLRASSSALSFACVDKFLIRSFLAHIGEELKPKTVKRKVATLKVFFSFLEFEDVIPVSPFRKMRVNIATDFRLPVVLTLAEVTRLFEFMYRGKQNSSKSEYRRRSLIRDIAVIELLFGTGIRVSELCRLKIDSVNLDCGVVKIFGKGRKERVIPICSSEIITALKAYVSEFDCIGQKGTRYMFRNRMNEPMSEQTVRLIVSRHVRNASIEKNVTPHTFRHTFATLLLDNGLDIRNIQFLLGHSTILTTQIYTQVSWERQRVHLTKLHPRVCLSYS